MDDIAPEELLKINFKMKNNEIMAKGHPIKNFAEESKLLFKLFIP